MQNCKSCANGYYLKPNRVCVPYSCVCTNGKTGIDPHSASLGDQDQCEEDGAENCKEGSCKAGYKLGKEDDAKKCVEINCDETHLEEDQKQLCGFSFFGKTSHCVLTQSINSAPAGAGTNCLYTDNIRCKMYPRRGCHSNNLHAQMK